MKGEKKYKVIGLMSGTSLDGLDVAYCEFHKRTSWRFRILKAETFKYTKTWREKLSTAHQLNPQDLEALHTEYGAYLGILVQRFMKANQIKTVDLIASHGHTVFHQPERKFTFQLGSGAALHAQTGWPVAFDFRSLDVALGGEGAPLVPVGDKLLFPDFDVCINLGGIANLSMDSGRQRIAFDLAFCNMGLNLLSGLLGKSFDRNGRISSTGNLDMEFYRSLSGAYTPLRKKRPSLGREIFERDFEKILQNSSVPVSDRLRTFTTSIADEIALAIPQKQKLKILCTGGGALNGFLIQQIKEKVGKRAMVCIPDEQIISFKEAMVFAFLGVLHLRKETNVLKSVTHASRDSCGGSLLGNTMLMD